MPRSKKQSHKIDCQCTQCTKIGQLIEKAMSNNSIGNDDDEDGKKNYKRVTRSRSKIMSTKKTTDGRRSRSASKKKITTRARSRDGKMKVSMMPRARSRDGKMKMTTRSKKNTTRGARSRQTRSSNNKDDGITYNLSYNLSKENDDDDTIPTKDYESYRAMRMIDLYDDDYYPQSLPALTISPPSGSSSGTSSGTSSASSSPPSSPTSSTSTEFDKNNEWYNESLPKTNEDNMSSVRESSEKASEGIPISVESSEPLWDTKNSEYKDKENIDDEVKINYDTNTGNVIYNGDIIFNFENNELKSRNDNLYNISDDLKKSILHQAKIEFDENDENDVKEPLPPKIKITLDKLKEELKIDTITLNIIKSYNSVIKKMSTVWSDEDSNIITDDNDYYTYYIINEIKYRFKHGITEETNVWGETFLLHQDHKNRNEELSKKLIRDIISRIDIIQNQDKKFEIIELFNAKYLSQLTTDLGTYIQNVVVMLDKEVDDENFEITYTPHVYNLLKSLYQDNDDDKKYHLPTIINKYVRGMLEDEELLKLVNAET